MYTTSNKPGIHPVASKIITSANVLFRNATTENWSVNWTTVNCPRGGDKKQCQIPTWGVGTPGGEGGWDMKLTSVQSLSGDSDI